MLGQGIPERIRRREKAVLMKSISYAKILAALESGRTISKYDGAALVPCDQRTAQRTLAKIHKEGKIHISKWVPHHHIKIPAYTIGEGKDKPKPAPIPHIKSVRKHRAKNREEINKRKKLKRLANGAYKSRAKYEIFNLIARRDE